MSSCECVLPPGLLSLRKPAARAWMGQTLGHKGSPAWRAEPHPRRPPLRETKVGMAFVPPLSTCAFCGKICPQTRRSIEVAETEYGRS